MKKLIMIFVCLAVIVGIGVGIFMKLKAVHVSMEDVLPQKALVYVQLQDVEKNLGELSAMPIWQGIRNINYDLLAQKNVLGDQQRTFMNLIKDQLLDVLENPLSKKIFGQEVAVAIYLPDQDIDKLVEQVSSFNVQAIREMFSGLFLVTRVDPEVQLAEFVSRFFGQFGNNVSQARLEYKEEAVHVITVERIGLKFGIVRLNDVLVMGLGEQAAKKSIDVFKGSQPSLAQDLHFGQVKGKFLHPSNMTGFFNVDMFLNILKSQGEGLVQFAGEDMASASAQGQWEQFLAQITGLKAAGFSSKLKPVIQIDSTLTFDSAQLSVEYAPLYACPPDENKTIHFIPENVLAYQWSNCFKLDHYWNQMLNELGRLDGSGSKLIEFESKLGMSVENDILPAFGEEIGGYIKDIQLGGIFPIPEFLLFIKIKDRSKTQKLINKLQEQPLVTFQEENQSGITVKYIPLPFGDNAQPGYCFLEDYLLISTGRHLLRDSIKALQGTGKSLLEDPDFKAIDFGLTSKNRSVQFLKIGQIIDKTKGVIDWSNQWITARDQKTQAFKAGSEKPLEEVRAVIAQKEKELEEMNNKIVLLEDEIWNQERTGVDATAKQIEFNELENQLAAKKSEIASENERKKGLEAIVEEYKESAPDPALRQLYLDEIIFPVLESLKSIKSYGLRATVGDNMFESSVFFKVK